MKHPTVQTPDPPGDDFTIPPPLRRELATMADQVKAGPLLALAKLVPELGRGLRLTAANVKYIRQRLAAHLLEHGHLSDDIRLFLIREGLNGQLVLVLSTAVLKGSLPELLTIHGRERLLAALAVDDRAEVRQLVAVYCQGEDWQQRPLPEANEALASLGERLAPFLELMHSLAGGATPAKEGDAAAAMAAELDGCRQKVAALESRLRQAREEHKVERKSDDKVVDLRQQVEGLSAKLARERQARLAVQDSLARATSDLDGLRQAQEKAVTLRVEAEMQAVVRRWLAAPARLDKAVAELAAKTDQDIVERARLALSQQAERDRHFGNRSRLRRRLKELRQAEDGLLQAAGEALNPLPELTSLLSELQTEAARIEELLGEETQATPMTKRLAVLIRQADNQGGLARVKTLLQELMACGCLSPAEGRTLYRDYHDCLGRLFDRFAPQPLTVSKETDPGLIVVRGVSGEGRFHWLLDGYNILFGLPELFAASYEDGRPATGSRQLLLTLVDRRLSGSDSLAEVFFDGAESHQENFTPRVRAVYSGGGGAEVRNRADQAIIDWLESQPPTADLTPIVVTNDRDLMARCQALKVKVMPLPQFAALLTLTSDSPGRR